jgi:predicted outer membrane lipoprotein
MGPRYRHEAAVQPAFLSVLETAVLNRRKQMPTIAHRPFGLPGRAPHRLTTWLLGALLVAAVATALALSLIGSGSEQTDQPVNSQQAAPQGPTPFGGAHP